MDSKNTGTRGNPSSPLYPVVSDLERLLRESRQRLNSIEESIQDKSVSKSSGEFIHHPPSSNLPTIEEDKGKEYLSILIPEVQNPS